MSTKKSDKPSGNKPSATQSHQRMPKPGSQSSEKNLGRLQSPRAEESIIGGALLDNSVLDDLVSIVHPADFFGNANREIFEIIVDLYGRGESVDPIILEDKLVAAGSFDQYGGIDKINNLVDSGTSAHEVLSYAKTVADLAMVRRINEMALEIRQTNYSDFDSISEYLSTIDSKFQKVMERRPTGRLESIKDVMRSAMDTIGELYDKRQLGQLNQLKTGFYDLDNKLSIDSTDLVILAARPSMGKSALGLSIVTNSCDKPGDAAAFYSLEMSKYSLALRMIASNSKINLKKFRTVDLSDGDFSNMAMAMGRISEKDIWLDDTPNIGPGEIRASARRLKAKLDRQGKNLRLIGVDYLQLCKTVRGHSRDREVAEVSAALKGLAMELQVPVLALSQLSRAVEKRENKRPMMSDLRDSGAIEQDADAILFMYRDDYYDENSDKKGITEVIIGKQRNGTTGTTELKFDSEITKFSNLAKGYSDERF